MLGAAASSQEVRIRKAMLLSGPYLPLRRPPRGCSGTTGVISQLCFPERQPHSWFQTFSPLVRPNWPKFCRIMTFWVRSAELWPIGSRWCVRTEVRLPFGTTLVTPHPHGRCLSSHDRNISIAWYTRAYWPLANRSTNTRVVPAAVACSWRESSHHHAVMPSHDAPF